MAIDKAALIDEAIARLSPLEAECTLCPRVCRVDRRTTASKGSAGPAPPPGSRTPCSISGRSPSSAGRRIVPGWPEGAGGSGTVFFAGL